VSVVEQPEEPRIRLYTVDDERLWDSRTAPGVFVPPVVAERVRAQQAVLVELPREHDPFLRDRARGSCAASS
jgi:hypothetical protein